MKIASSKHGSNILCTQHVLPSSELAIFFYWTRNSMNNLLPYCGSVDAKKELLTKIYLYPRIYLPKPKSLAFHWKKNLHWASIVRVYNHTCTCVELPSLKFQQGTFPIQGAEISTFFCQSYAGWISPKFICPICPSKAKSLGFHWKKSFIGRPQSVCSIIRAHV